MATGKYQKWLEPQSLILLEGWARDGLTDEQIAQRIGIRRETLYAWKKDHPHISNAIKKGKEVVDYEVENRLLQRAMGMTVKETRKEMDANGRKRIVEVTREIPPDVGAQIWWLKNRRPDKWRDSPPEDIDTEDTDGYFDEAGLSE